ncbi:MAG: T9SS type A sorting domain-containing protein [Bacteroidia bacterium]|nr:T9SS type A sorting domain-containing protein [Bacteroidia bacterium]
MKKHLLSLSLLIGFFGLNAQIPLTGLRSFYTFNQTMQDSTSAASHFTPYNNPPVNNDVKMWANDRRTNVANGSFYSFLSGHFTAQPFNPGDSSGSFSVSVWVKMNSKQLDTKTILGDYKVINFFQGPSFGEGRFRLAMYNGHPQFILYNQNTATLIDDFVDSVSVGVWNHLAAVYDRPSASMRFYLNGKMVNGSSKSVSAPTTPFAPVNLGRTLLMFLGGPNPSTQTSELFDGTLDDLAFYNRSLTSCEVQQLANKAASSQGVEVYAFQKDLTASVSNAASYQWLNCETNQPVSGATQRLFSAVNRGYYKVVVGTGCGYDTSTCALAHNSDVTRFNNRGSYDFNTNLASISPQMADFEKVTSIANNPSAVYSTGRDGRPLGAFNSTLSGLYSATNLNTEQNDTPDISAFIWVKRTSFISDAFVVSDFSATNGTPKGSFYIRIINNVLRIGVVQRNGNVLFADADPADSIPLNTWVNLGFVLDRAANTARGFVDGEQVCFLQNAIHVGPCDYTYLGAYLNKNMDSPSKGLSFTGDFDDLYMYDRALGECDINKMFGKPVPAIRRDLVKVSDFALNAMHDLVYFQWIDCDTKQAIPGANKKTFLATRPGNYAVVINNGCSQDTSLCYYLAVGSTGMEEELAYNLQVYPNPSQGTIQVEGVAVQRLELYSLSGQFMLSTEQSELDIASMEQGIYLLHVKDKQGRTRICKVVRN